MYPISPLHSSVQRAHVGLALTQSPRQSAEEEEEKSAQLIQPASPGAPAAGPSTRVVAGRRRAAPPPSRYAAAATAAENAANPRADLNAAMNNIMEVCAENSLGSRMWL